MEHFLEGEVYALVSDSVGQSPSKVDCTFISESDLAVLVENVRTPVEVFLQRYCKPETATAYRKGMEQALEQRIRRLLEKKLNRSIHHVAMSHQTAARWMGIFVLL